MQAVTITAFFFLPCNSCKAIGNEPDLYYKAFHLYDENSLKELEDIISQIDNESSVMVKDDTFKKLLKKASLDYIELVLNSSVCIKNILPEYTPSLFINTFPRRKFENSQEMIRFIDIFCNTPGINAAASTFVGLVRWPVQKLFSMVDDYDEQTPRLSLLGGAFIRYAIFLTLIHHIVLISIESFSYFNLEILLQRILLSTLLTSLLVFAFEGLSFKKKNSWQKTS